MSSSSQKNSEKENKSEEIEKEQQKDAQMDEKFDIDEIQQQLQDDTEDDSVSDSDFDFEIGNESEDLSEEDEIDKPIDERIKKYVIYVESDNIDYIDNLSVTQRKELINNVLREQNKITIEERNLQKKKRLITHVILACVTFLIALPLLFFLVNTSTDITINNYNKAKENFVNLYKKQGKIKMQQSPLY